MKKKKLLFYSFLAIIFISAFIVRLWPLEQSFQWDETVYLQHTEVIVSGRDNYDEFYLRPPLLHLMISFFYLFKHHVYTAGVVVAALGTIGVIFSYLVGKELYNETIGLVTAIFLAFTNVIVISSHSIMTEVPSLTFITISFYLLIIANKKNSNLFYSLAGLFLSLSILTRFTSLIMLAVFPIYLLVYKIKFKKIKYLLISFLLSLSPYLIWAKIKYGSFFYIFINARAAVSDKVNGIFFYFTNFTDAFPVVVLFGFLVFFVFFLVKISKIKKSNNNMIERLKKIAMKNKIEFVLISWFLLFFAYMNTLPHKEARFLILVALPVFLLSAKGYYFLFNQKQKKVRNISIIIFILLSLCSFTYIYIVFNKPFINNEVSDTVEISRYLVSLNKSDHVIYTNNNYPILAYYTNMETKLLYYYDMSYYEVNKRELTRKGFIVYYLDFGKNSNKEWLDSNFNQLKQKNNIIVYEYNP